MDDSIEALLDKATNPKNRYEDWEFIMAFCDKVNASPEGPQVALKIIPAKMQSKEEKVALLALTLLEACVKNCGKRFHEELGKFRFLNEVIKMLSPKYLGNDITMAVKKRMSELLYSWKVGLPGEPKVNDAYNMLKEQGLVFDESAPKDPTLEASEDKPKVGLEMDRKQSDVLGRLLRSKNPEDLRAANRLIKEAVKKDDRRMDKLKKKLEELDMIQNNIKLLNELLAHYKPDSGETERQLMKELYDQLDKQKTKLFKMANNVGKAEEGMAEVLKTNDDLLRVMERYKVTMVTVESTDNETGLPPAAENTANGETAIQDTPSLESTLIDLADLNFTTTTSTGGGGQSIGSFLDTLPPVAATPTGVSATSQSNDPFSFLGNLSAPPTTTANQSNDPFGFLGNLSAPPTSITSQSNDPFGITTTTPAPPTSMITIPPPVSHVPSIPAETDVLPNLNDIFVPLETITPGTATPLQIVSKNGVTVTLHFTEVSPAPNIMVIVISIVSMSVAATSNVLFQAAVPKMMRLKLQPPTSNEMKPYSPLAPPPNITQVMLLANPNKAKVRLRYRLSFIQNEQELTEIGEASDFPNF
ncbi:ADP-ribosylation factor-binding protein GGA3-like isoform X2 [Dysidea avara]|uniref:ADP-ribosylation factor-binding protein GGA3-like isoform X2 n=1 Tax=Dysidea avara TaxID=196820 RepID=UPI0033174776